MSGYRPSTFIAAACIATVVNIGFTPSSADSQDQTSSRLNHLIQNAVKVTTSDVPKTDVNNEITFRPLNPSISSTAFSANSTSVNPDEFERTAQASFTSRQANRSTAILPPDENVQQSTTLEPGDQGAAQGIKNKVKVDVDPATGIITLVGDKDDVELVKRAIAELSANAAQSQPATQRILLSNVQSDSIAEDVQALYDENYAAGNGKASITPLDSPNSLLVVGQAGAIDVVRQIVSAIDVETEDEVESDFRTFKLQHISAADAKTRLDTYFSQANQGDGDNQLPSAPVTTIVDFRSNSLIVRGAPQFLAQAAQLVRELDIDKSKAVNVVRVFPLKNTLAEDMAIVLQDAINGQQPNAGQGFIPNQQTQGIQTANENASPEQSRLRSAMLQLRTISRDGQDIDGGIMFDVRVTADRNSNSLIVTGPEASMALIEALIAQLDTIPAAETQIKVFQIINGDAETLLDMLNNLFNSANNQQQGGFAGGQAGQGISNLSQLPLQGTSATDGATLVNLRFSIDPRTNTIIASGPAGDLQVVEDLLNRLDEAEVNQRRVFVYRLSNAPALDVSEAINTWLETRASVNDEDPRALGGVNQTNREVIVVPEVVSNSLIVSALPEYYMELQQVIQALDRRPPMVKVKVMIAEVDLDSVEEFGVDVGIQDSLLFDRGTVFDLMSEEISAGNGFDFNGQNTSNQKASLRETLAGQALSNLGTGRINSELGYGGLVLSAGNESINILLRALKNKQCVRVLSKPHIMTLENLQGRVSIGAEVPRITGVTQSNFGVTNNVEFTDVGVILEITPRVSPDGMIVMFVNATKSSVGPEETGIPIFVNDNGNVIRSPQILATQAQTTVMAKSGQTIVFSGLVQEDKTHVERGIPILSDLPVVGPLFKFETDSASRSELLIVMTPYLVDDEHSLEKQNRDEIDRMHWCLCDVAEVYGNTDYNSEESFRQNTETIYPDYDPQGAYPNAPLGQEIAPGIPFSDRQGDTQEAGPTAKRKPSSFDKIRQASARLKNKMRPNAMRESFDDFAERTGSSVRTANLVEE